MRFFFFFQAEDGIRDADVTGVQTCALPIFNFGGFGGVIVHEITHHFDDEGRKFDVAGTVAPWWSPDDIASYQARAACFVDEYAQFHIDDGTPVDGRLTLGENLADNGGLRLAWDALRPEA